MVKHKVILSIITVAIKKEKKKGLTPVNLSITVLLFVLETRIALAICLCYNFYDCWKNCCINVYLGASSAIMMP